MDYLGEITTVEDKDLVLFEIAAIKRKDFGSVRKSFLDNIANIDLNDLAKKVKNLETVKIILGISPTTGIVETIKNFFKINLDKQVVFDFEVDKEIIGGLQIIYKGKYFDSSYI